MSDESQARGFILDRRCRQARPALSRADARPVWGRPGRYDGRTYRRRRDAWRRAGCPVPLAALAGRFRCGARIGIPRRLVRQPIWSRAIGISQPRDRIRSMDPHLRCICIQFPQGRDTAGCESAIDHGVGVRPARRGISDEPLGLGKPESSILNDHATASVRRGDG